jgi:tetratricopeptide (TPR) repeat protein
MAAYDAFVSYSHAKDKPIAAALQSVIQTLGKPWYRRRALRVFRDDTSLSATPSLWPSIETALGNSRFLILLASPEAAASPWVNKEISSWLDHKSADTLLIALTDGELSWDNATGDFAACERMPLPPVLAGRFASEPKWVDLRAYRDGANPRDARFIEAGADFAAAIRGMPKEDLLSQEVRQQRRALTLAWSAAGSLLILAGLAGWQWTVAIEQRDRAERTLAAATQTANNLVFQLAQEFQDRSGMPVDLIRKILDRAQQLQRQLAEAGEASPDLRRSEASAQIGLVDTMLALGETDSALATAERARSIMQELVATNPGNKDWLQLLSVSHDKVADVLMRLGRREQAIAEFRRALAITETLTAAGYGNKKALSSALWKIAYLLVDVGRAQEALKEGQQAMTIARELAGGDPRNMDWQAHLSSNHYMMGYLLMVMGQPDRAFDEYWQSLVVGERAAAGDPENAVRQRDLSTTYNGLGDALMATGKLDDALSSYRRGLDIVGKLAAAQPRHTEWQSDLWHGHVRIGRALREAGRREEALAVFRTSLAIVEKLSAADPGNADWQSDLVISLDNLSTLAEPQEARAALGRAVAIADALAQADKLMATRKNWPQHLRDQLAKLPPEQAEAK